MGILDAKTGHRSGGHRARRERHLATAAVGLGGAFSPLNLPWLYAWWASDPGWANPGNGNAVSSWRESKGSGTNLVQATGANQPTYFSSVAAMNNKPAVTFNGTTQFLQVTYGAGIVIPYTCVAIGRSTDNTAALGHFMYDGLAGGRAGLFTTPTTGVIAVIGGATGNTTNVLLDSTQHILGGLYPAAGAFGFKDGTSQTAAGTNAQTMTGATLGANNAGVLWWPGDIAFFGIIAGDFFNGTSWASFRSWAQTTYGTP